MIYWFKSTFFMFCLSKLILFQYFQVLGHDFNRDLRSSIDRSDTQQQFYLTETFDQISSIVRRAKSSITDTFSVLSEPLRRTAKEYILVSKPLTLNRKENLKLAKILEGVVEGVTTYVHCFFLHLKLIVNLLNKNFLLVYLMPRKATTTTLFPTGLMTFRARSTVKTKQANSRCLASNYTYSIGAFFRCKHHTTQQELFQPKPLVND